MILVGAGALARKDGAAVASLAAKAAVDLGAVKDGWNGFSVLHNAASRVGALDLGFVPGEGGLTRAADGGSPARSMLLFLLGVDEIDIAPGAFVGLHRHAWRSRRGACGRGAAGRGLSGKVGDLCEYRRPCADGDARIFSAWRCARGLGDPARAVRCAGEEAAVRFACRAAPRALWGVSAFHENRSGLAGRCRRPPKACGARRRTRQDSVSFRASRTSISPTPSRDARR